MRKKIYTEIVHCAICGKPVGADRAGNKSRTLKSWMVVCSTCWREVEKRIEKIERIIEKLEKKVFAK